MKRARDLFKSTTGIVAICAFLTVAAGFAPAAAATRAAVNSGGTGADLAAASGAMANSGRAGADLAAAHPSRASHSPKATSGASAQTTPRHPSELHLSPLKFEPHAADVVTLPCGIPVVLVENHDLPILDVVARFRLGTSYLPVEQRAAANLLSAVWRSGGTTDLPPDSLDAHQAALGVTIASNVGTRAGGVSISLASEDWKAALPLWREVVIHPRFDQERLAKAQADRIRDLQAINNDPDAIAGCRLSWLVEGQDDPDSHVESSDEVNAVKQADLVALDQRFVHPKNLVLGVAGDFDRAAMLSFLDQLFGDWMKSAGTFQPPVLLHPAPHPQPGVYFLPGDYEQSQVRIGRALWGLNDDSPDAPSASILSFAFGYGRVFYRVRSDGLSYGATIMLRTGEDRSTIDGFGSCRGEVTVKLLRDMLDELNQLPKKQFTSQELETARTFQVGRQVRQSETPAGIMDQQVTNQLLGRPDDWDLRVLHRLQNTDLTDMSRLAGQYLKNDSLVVLVLGKEASLGSALDSLGLGPATELKPVEFGK